MSRITFTRMLPAMLFCLMVINAPSQIPIADIIKEAIKKVIKATDLMVQRIQNKTIILQNAQRALENEISKLRLQEIGSWVEKQKQLYSEYYKELWKVKATLTTSNRVGQIILAQSKILAEYQRAIHSSRQDAHFTADELAYIEKVYGGILSESLKNLEQLSLVVNDFKTQMSDGKRLELINKAAVQTNQNLVALRQFHQQNIRMSIQRSKDEGDVANIRRLYGIEH